MTKQATVLRYDDTIEFSAERFGAARQPTNSRKLKPLHVSDYIMINKTIRLILEIFKYSLNV